MKRIICILVCIALLAGFSACGGDGRETVSVNIPAIYLSEAQLADLDAYCESNGYISAKHNRKDDTVTLKMTKVTNDMMLVSIGMDVIGSIYKLVESDTFPYFLEVAEYAQDFTSITLEVDAEKYNADSTKSLLSMTVGESCLMYGVYTTNDNPECTVTVVDAKTGEVLDTTTHNTKES